MNVDLNEEQQLLKDSVAKFCEGEAPLEKIREWADNPKGLPDELWEKIAAQGWLGIIVPEENGGLGLGVTELAVITEEMGRNLLPGPFLSSVLAAQAIAIGGTDAAKEKYLERIVSGETIGTLALLEEDGQLYPDSIQRKAEKSGDGYQISGKKSLVPDADAATLFVVAARTGDGVSLFLVDREDGGVSTQGNRLFDATARNGQLVLDDVSVAGDALLGESGTGWDILKEVLLTANVCLAGECVAASERILKMTIVYAKERVQFGKVIGSFQAVKHPLADLYADIESARSAYHYAAWAVDAKTENRQSAAAVARLTATGAYRKTTLDCLQAHGGIGFTWEYDLHLFLKRAKHNEYLYGVPHDYEEQVVADALGV